MATQTLEPVAVRFMRRALQVDGIVTAGFGVLLTLGAGVVGTISGIESTGFVQAAGLASLVYGLLVLYVSMSRNLDSRLPPVFVVINALWELGSLYVLLADPFTMTNEGRWFVLLQGDLVVAFAIWQFVALRRMRQAGL